MPTLSRVRTHLEPYAPSRPRHDSTLRIVRTISGLTAAELARLAEVDPVTIRRLEAGRCAPRAATAEKLASALGWPVDRLFPKGATSHAQIVANVLADGGASIPSEKGGS